MTGASTTFGERWQQQARPLPMPEGSRLHAARSSSLNGPVRVGVVGLGVMGSEHARVLAASPAAELLGCVDPQPAAARNSPPGVPVFAGIEEMLSATDLEAIVVATPEDAHRGPVEKAFAAGLDVLVEKPIAGCLEDADTLIATANRTGRRLTVGHLLRFDPRYAHVRDEVEAGTLGEIVHLTARRNCLRGEGAVVARRSSLPLYMGVHDLDVMQWFAGPITRVYAEAASRGLVGAGWDTIVATLSFRSGAVGVLELCWALPKQSNLAWDCAASVVGSKACAYIEIRSMGVSIFGSGGVRYPEVSYWPVVHGEPTGILRAQDEHFLASVRDGRPAVQEPREARSALAVALALEESLALGAPVEPSRVGEEAL